MLTKPYAMRPMLEAHLPRVEMLRRETFGGNLADLRKLHSKPNVHNLLVVSGDVVAGYMLHKFRKGDVEILEVAVDPLHRRRGVGRMLVADIKRFVAKRNRYEEAWALVPCTNLDGARFFAACGFDARTEPCDFVRMAWRHRGDAVRNRVAEYFLREEL